MADFDYNKVKAPQFFCENRLEAHSDHAFYASYREARQLIPPLRLPTSGKS